VGAEVAAEATEEAAATMLEKSAELALLKEENPAALLGAGKLGEPLQLGRAVGNAPAPATP